MLTASIADEARKLMEQIAGEGGYTKAKAWIDQAIAASRAAKEKAVAQRRRVLVGVTDNPDSNETKDPSGLPRAPSGIWRAADPFEDDTMTKADVHAKQTGHQADSVAITRGDLRCGKLERNSAGTSSAVADSPSSNRMAPIPTQTLSFYAVLIRSIRRSQRKSFLRLQKPVIIAGKEQDILRSRRLCQYAVRHAQDTGVLAGEIAMIARRRFTCR